MAHHWTLDDHRFALKAYLDELDGHTHMGRSAVIELVRSMVQTIEDKDLTDSISMLFGNISYILNKHHHKYWATFTTLYRTEGELERRIVDCLRCGGRPQNISSVCKNHCRKFQT